MNALRCILGARVSTDEQAQHGTSLAAQVEAGRSKVAALGGVVVGTCIEPGVSGAEYETRAELQSALQKLEADEADALVWWDLTRLSRDVAHMARISARVENAGKQLIFCTAEYADNADGFVMKAVASAFSHGERLKFRERSIKGRLERAKSGLQPSRSKRPFGYLIITTQHVLDGLYPREMIGRYVVVESEAEIVKKLFEWRAAGYGLRPIVRLLHDHGIPPMSRSGAPGLNDNTKTENEEPVAASQIGYWTGATVGGILRNPVYKGKPEYGRRRNVRDDTRLSRGVSARYQRATPHESRVILDAPPIVSAELWDTVQQLMNETPRTGGSPDSAYLLRGVLKCPICGGAMNGTRAGGVAFYRAKAAGDISLRPRRYRCARATLNDPTKRCRAFLYPADVLEEQVIEAIEAVCTPAAMRAYFASHRTRAQEATKDAAQTAAAAATARVKRASARRDALLEAQLQAIEDGRDATPFRARLNEVERELESAKAEQSAAPLAPAPPTFSQAARLARLATQTRDILRASPELVPIHRKSEVLRLLISSAVPRSVSPDEWQIEINFRTETEPKPN